MNACSHIVYYKIAIKCQTICHVAGKTRGTKRKAVSDVSGGVGKQKRRFVFIIIIKSVLNIALFK